MLLHKTVSLLLGTPGMTLQVSLVPGTPGMTLQ